MKNVLILFGGNSTEHEISIISAQNIINNIDKSRYNIYNIYISLSCQWKYINQENITDITGKFEKFDDVVLFNNGISVLLHNIKQNKIISTIDFAFPVLHGKNGEDGAIQGLLNMLNLPYAGSSIPGTCLSMDKEIAKILVEKSGIPVTRYLVCHIYEEPYLYENIAKQFGLPFIMKPCSFGSSIGVYKIYDKAGYQTALIEIYKLDSKLLIEECLEIRELECGVIGNFYPVVSPQVGEVKSNDDFYSYSAKYENTEYTKIIIPAEVSNQTENTIKQYSERIYQRLQCQGFARVDFFLTKEDKVIFNELNAIPGFTNMSMFPLLWKQKFNSIKDLISVIIELGQKAKN